MKAILQTARIVVGIAFIFSGIVKGDDPLGSAYKFNDYFQAFNLEALSFLSLPLAILLCTVEFTAGISLLTGIRMRAGITLVMILLVFFTPLTFFLALTNPVSDCGCFGDAIKLTNWQTFWKNVILITLTLLLFLNRRRMNENTGQRTQWIFTGAVLLFILFCLFNLRNLPVMDFLPYRKGVNIADQMSMPAGAAADKYETTFIYEKNGTRKEFTLDNYPSDDSSWKFIDQKSVMVEKGYTPPIHDFSIKSSYGDDLTAKILSHEGYSVFMIVKKLESANMKRLQKGFDLGSACMNNAIDFYVLTASGADEIRKFENGLQFCNVDETTLKTMVRSDPGYMVIKDGMILEKWSWATMPEKDRVVQLYAK
jgi:uncharacterized membrane protein YphA (DoxX/SURF4 family)